MEKISVIVPIYNAQKYLEKCLKSLEIQTFRDYEVVLVNDGSKDESEKIIQKFLKNKKFIYFKKENGGVSSARNFGIEHATGDYITFVDADDTVTNDYLELLYNTCKEKKVDISIGAFERNYKEKTTFNPVYQENVEMFCFSAPWGKLYKKSVIEEYQLEFPKKLWYEDLYFTTCALLVGTYAVINKNIYHYYQNETSLVHTYDDRIFDIYEIVKRIEEFAKDQQIYEMKKQAIEFINIYHILIGTVYRASFHKDFSRSLIKEIYCKVKEKYPKWYNNSNIKKLPLFYRVYLFFLKCHFFVSLYLLLKVLHNKVKL